jgi:hypothetical protein
VLCVVFLTQTDLTQLHMTYEPDSSSSRQGPVRNCSEHNSGPSRSIRLGILKTSWVTISFSWRAMGHGDRQTYHQQQFMALHFRPLQSEVATLFPVTTGTHRHHSSHLCCCAVPVLPERRLVLYNAAWQLVQGNPHRRSWFMVLISSIYVKPI